MPAAIYPQVQLHHFPAAVISNGICVLCRCAREEIESCKFLHVVPETIEGPAGGHYDVESWGFVITPLRLTDEKGLVWSSIWQASMTSIPV